MSTLREDVVPNVAPSERRARNHVDESLYFTSTNLGNVRSVLRAIAMP